MEHTIESDPLRALRRDIEAQNVELSESEWEEVSSICQVISYEKKAEITARQKMTPSVLFVTNGVCADQITRPEGHSVIGRFFKPGDFCAETKLSTDEHTPEHNILATTYVEGVLIPMALWLTEYFDGGGIGLYARKKMFQAHNFDIDLMRVKTLNRTIETYEFLKTRQPCVIQVVAQIYIAQFLGITPEGLSRFLRTKP